MFTERGVLAGCSRFVLTREAGAAAECAVWLLWTTGPIMMLLMLPLLLMLMLPLLMTIRTADPPAFAAAAAARLTSPSAFPLSPQALFAFCRCTAAK
jgi:hypothetical protein